jgi:hypothetical protein
MYAKRTGFPSGIVQQKRSATPKQKIFNLHLKDKQAQNHAQSFVLNNIKKEIAWRKK